MRRIGTAAVALLIAACASQATAPITLGTAEDSFARVNRMFEELDGKCRYPVMERHQANRELVCQLDALRQRCNKIDDCYVYCIGRDVGEGIGGGCVHLCNYRLLEEWAPPESAKKCSQK